MSRRIILWSVAAVLGIAATAIAIVRIGGSNRSQSVQPKIVLSHVSEVVSSDPSQGSQARGPAEIIRFRLTESGLRPFEAHATPGWVAIYFEDRSQTSVGLVVQRESGGAALGQLNRREGRWRDGSRIFLPRGRYRIIEPNHPLNAATLIVEP